MSSSGILHEYKTFQLSDGSLVNVDIMDTCGQEMYRALNSQYYKKADGILLVYDITKKESFEEIKTYYLEQIKNNCKSNVKVVLLGNKTDLEKDREVKTEDGINFAVENGYEFMESSCLKNRTVADGFETLIESTYRENVGKIGVYIPEKNIKITSGEKKSGGCYC